MKQYFREIKVVTTNKEHNCVVCGHPVLKGSRAVNEHGRNEEGFFNSYVHLERSKGCYLDFIEVVCSDKEEAKIILGNVIEEKVVG